MDGSLGAAPSRGAAQQSWEHLPHVLVPLEITALLGAAHPGFTLFHLQTHPDFALCVCAENVVTAASISPSHSSFQTGKPPEPLFFFFFLH